MHNEKIPKKRDPFVTIDLKSNIVSKFKIVSSQCFALLAIDFLKFAHGYFGGFAVVFISILYKENAEITMTLNELTWFGSSCFMMPVGSIFGGILANRIGARLLFITSAFICATCALLFHFACSSAVLLCAQALTGMAGGLFKGSSFTYIAEISQPYLRSTLMAISNFSVLLGVLTGTIVSGHLYWRNVVLINLVFITLGLILIFFIPESPYWLASKRRYYEAKLALAWLRGWSDPESIEAEFQTILKNLKCSSTFSIESMDKASAGKSKRQSRFKETLRALVQKTFYIPLMTMCYVFLINEFGGGLTVKTFSMLIFKQIDSPIHAHTASSVLVAIPIVAGIFVILTIHIIGKRKLAFFSLIGCGLSYAMTGGYGILKVQNFFIAQNPTLDWIPTICLLLAILTSSLGIDKIAFLLNSELFPTRFRQVGTGIGHSLSTLFNALLNKLFLYMVNAMTLPGVFLFFSVVNIVGFIIIYFILPETERKSLKEIEDHYAGVKCFQEMVAGHKDEITDKDNIVRRPLFRTVQTDM